MKPRKLDTKKQGKDTLLTDFDAVNAYLTRDLTWLTAKEPQPGSPLKDYTFFFASQGADFRAFAIHNAFSMDVAAKQLADALGR